MKKVILVVLGLGVVLVLAEVLRRNLEKLSVQETEPDDFWYRLSGPMMAYAGLSAYVNDRRSFSNQVWEDGINRHLHELKAYLEPLRLWQFSSYNHKVECWNLSGSLRLKIKELEKLVESKERAGMKGIVTEIGDILENMIGIGEQAKYNQMVLA